MLGELLKPYVLLWGHKHDSIVSRMFEGKVQIARPSEQEPLAGVFSAQPSAQIGHEDVRGLRDELKEHGFFVLEVAIDRGSGDFGTLGYLAHAQASQSLT